LNEAVLILASFDMDIVDVAVSSWDESVEASAVLVRSEAAAEHRHLLTDGRSRALTNQIRGRLEAGMATSAPDYIDAQRVAQRLRRELDALFERVDILVLPARERTAPHIDEGGRRRDPDRGPGCAVPLNIAGLPALAIPCGFDDHRLPISVQLVGRAWADDTLLAVAHRFQQVTDWHSRRPPTAFEELGGSAPH
jgi:aspartyl-tRNA(Asn)/glutamyl-tRNA(Gln) amidotransferase subunit A